MQSKQLQLNFSSVTIAILLAVFSRLLPHPANFAPMMAIGIFGGALFLKKAWALIIPIASIWISDLAMNNIVYGDYFDHFVWFYDGFYWQYGVYILIPILSVVLFKNNISAAKVLGMSIGSALIFFIISNFGVWAGSNMYPKTILGLLDCYIMGLPFLKGSLISNIFYSSVLFGAYFMLENKSSIFVSMPKHQWKWI